MRQIPLCEIGSPFWFADSDGNRAMDYELSHTRLGSFGLDPLGPGEAIRNIIVWGIVAQIRRDFAEQESERKSASEPKTGV